MNFFTALPKSSSEWRVLVLHNADFTTSIENAPKVANRDVLNAAQEITQALASRGHFVQMKGIDLGDLPGLIADLMRDPPDVVFNLCESLGQKDSNELVVPVILDALDIPYTGSDALALGIALKKEKTALYLKNAGICTPDSMVFYPDSLDTADIDDKLQLFTMEKYPLIVKPAWQNASIGIDANSVVLDESELRKQMLALFQHRKEPVLVEQYIYGKELNVSFVGNPASILPIYEIDFTGYPRKNYPVVCYKSKWEPSSIEYKTTRPRLAELPKKLIEKVEETVFRVINLLDLYDYGRVDIRLSKEGTPYVIDINPNCDLSSQAGFAKAAASAGATYAQLIEVIVNLSMERKKNETKPKSYSSFFMGDTPSGSQREIFDRESTL